MVQSLSWMNTRELIWALVGLKPGAWWFQVKVKKLHQWKSVPLRRKNVLLFSIFWHAPHVSTYSTAQIASSPPLFFHYSPFLFMLFFPLEPPHLSPNCRETETGITKDRTRNGPVHSFETTKTSRFLLCLSQWGIKDAVENLQCWSGCTSHHQ